MLVFVPRFLISIGRSQDVGFAARRADNLQSNWQALLSESARNRDGRQSPDIDCSRVAQEKKFDWAKLCSISRQVSDSRSGNRGRRHEENVNILELLRNIVARLLKF